MLECHECGVIIDDFLTNPLNSAEIGGERVFFCTECAKELEEKGWKKKKEDE